MARGKGRQIESADTIRAGLGGADTMAAVVSGSTDIESGDVATDPQPEPTVIESGSRIGRYVVLSPLGVGGMSRVFRAFDPKLGRQVALKVVTPHRTEGWSADDERARVVREAQAIAKLSHPNVVAVHDVGVDGDIVFIAMELIAGRTLREWQRIAQRSWRDVVGIYVQAGRGLVAAHAAELIHRDFKPENVLVGDDGRARVVDFGLARTSSEAVTTPSSMSGDDLESSISQPLSPLTRAGTILGTPGYMAPEQYGGTTDDKSDQFSFCVALFEALWGRRPFPGRTVHELRQNVLAGTMIDARGGKVPARIRTLVMRGLRLASGERHPSMSVLLAELERAAAPRRIGLALAGGVGLVGIAVAALAVASRQEAASPCRASARKLDGVWDTGLRARLEQLFARDAERPAATWERVRSDLDGFATAWAGKHRQVCEATRVHGEQSEQALDLRMACLDRQLGDVRQLTGLLVTGDAATLERAAVASRHLPDLTECDDLRALEAVAPPPDDFAVRAQLGEVEAEVARARALADAGKLSEARTTAEGSLGRARRIGHAPVLARALFTRGVIARLEGDGTAGRTLMFEALTAAEEAGDDALAAHAAAELVFTAGYLADDPDDGLAFARLAEAILRRVGGRDAIAGLLHNNLGVLHLQAQRFAESATELERGLTLREKVYGPDAFDLVSSLNNLGSVLTELGRNEEARRHFERAARILDGLFGPVHPHRAAVLVNLALAETELGQADDALGHYREAQAIYEKVVGSSHPMVAPALTNQADLLADLGDLDAAIPLYERAIAIRQEANGPEHPSVALALLGQGTAMRQSGRLEDAATRIDRARRIWEKARGADDADVARAHHQLGAIRLAQGRTAEARQSLERALTIDEKVLGADHRGLVPVLISLGELATAGSDVATATRHYERAVAIAEARHLPAAESGPARFGLAQILWRDPAQRSRARALAVEARGGYAALGKLGTVHLKPVDTWLASHQP